MYLKLDFQNSKWRIQNGGRQVENPINFCDTLYSKVFGVADYESEIRLSKFKIADLIWWACRQTTQVSKFRTCQTSEVRILDGHKITKSHSSEVSIHRKAIYPTFRKPEVLFPRIVITPTYRSPESPNYIVVNYFWGWLQARTLFIDTRKHQNYRSHS